MGGSSCGIFIAMDCLGWISVYKFYDSKGWWLQPFWSDGSKEAVFFFCWMRWKQIRDILFFNGVFPTRFTGFPFYIYGKRRHCPEPLCFYILCSILRCLLVFRLSCHWKLLDKNVVIHLSTQAIVLMWGLAYRDDKIGEILSVFSATMELCLTGMELHHDSHQSCLQLLYC